MQNNPRAIRKSLKPESQLLVNLAVTLNPSDDFVMGWANNNINKEPVKLKYIKPAESIRKQRKRKGKK